MQEKIDGRAIKSNTLVRGAYSTDQKQLSQTSIFQIHMQLFVVSDILHIFQRSIAA